jgi:hypothetical protein
LANQLFFAILLATKAGRGTNFPEVTMQLPRLIAVAFLAAGLAALFGVAASAEPLLKTECSQLDAERKKLLTREMQAALERGPDWVKDHLNDVELEKVRQFLIVEEKIVFRCRGGGVSPPKPEEIAKGIVPLPDRNPSRQPAQTADAKPDQASGDSSKTASSDAKN